MGDGSSLIYFFEFSYHFEAKDIHDTVKIHGDLSEVVIPPKRNKFGKRFGFSRFRDVGDIRLLAVTLDNIFIDNDKIYANIPRYNRKVVAGILNNSRTRKQHGARAHFSTSQGAHKGSGGRVGGRSFVEVVGKINGFQDILLGNQMLSLNTLLRRKISRDSGNLTLISWYHQVLPIISKPTLKWKVIFQLRSLL